MKSSNLQKKKNIEVEFASLAKEDLSSVTISDPYYHYKKYLNHKVLTFAEEQEIGRTMEAGKKSILRSLCESPTVIATISRWRKGLEEGSIRAFDIVDRNFMKPISASSAVNSIKDFAVNKLENDDLLTDAENADEDTANASDEIHILPEVINLLSEIERLDQQQKISPTSETKEAYSVRLINCI